MSTTKSNDALCKLSVVLAIMATILAICGVYPHAAPIAGDFIRSARAAEVTSNVSASK